MTRTPFRHAASVLLAVLLVAPVLIGQQPAQPNSPPRVAYVYPAGGQQGTTVKVAMAGQFLDGVSGVLVSGRDVRASVVGLDKPLNQRQVNDLRERIQAMQSKAAGDPAIRQQLVTMRAQLGDTVKRNRNPVMADIATIEVSLDANAEPGARQIRLRTPNGLSNPLMFEVGQLPEARERDLKNSRADAELTVTLPVTMNGRLIPGDVDNLRQPLRQPQQYQPGDVDRYRFQARKDQDLVVAVSARDLIPYLADAVPGWFQAVVTVYDAAGREVAYCDDYRFRPDPALHYRVPADGEYVVEIRDAIYRGREDFVYRISIGELPFITSAFPLGGPANAKTTVELTGWNLPVSRVTIDGRLGTVPATPGTVPVSVKRGAVESNRLPFAVGALPERAEREPNNASKDAQSVSLPVIVNGRVAQPGDRDVFRFQGRAGQPIAAEVTARRLGSPVDAVLELTDEAGKRLAFNDDRDDAGSGLLTQHADASFVATLPADGTYYVRLADVQHKGGADYAYRLRLSAPQPDFELRVAPSAINAATGANVAVTVAAIRKDGFAGDITVALRDVPPGFVLSGAVIPAGVDTIRMTVAAPPTATRDPIEVRLEGRATIRERPVVHDALAADDRMQAFAYRHFVPADDLRVAVSTRGGTRVPIHVLGPQSVTIPLGGSVRVRATLPAAYQTFENMKFELDAAPDGITIGSSYVAATQAEFLVQADPAKAKPGLRGNLIIIVSGERVPPPNAQGQAARRRVPIGLLPALAFEVTPQARQKAEGKRQK